jgi:hypothetical protein
MEPLPGFVPREKQKKKIEQQQAEQDMALFLKAAAEA